MIVLVALCCAVLLVTGLVLFGHSALPAQLGGRVQGADLARATATLALTLESDARAALTELIAAHDWDGARSTLEQLARQSPDDPEISYWRGLLLGADDPVAAEDYLRLALRSAALRAKAQAALDGLARGEGASPPDRWTALGVALVGVEEWTWAQHAFDAALAADPLHATALAYRGYVKDRQGLDGLVDIEAAQALAPRDPAGYYFAGLHWRSVEDYAASHQAFLEAHFLAPENPAFAAEVGGALELLGLYSDAEPWYRMAVELAPDEASWYALLARFYVDSGYRPDGAAYDFVETAAERFPEDADLAASSGWALFQQGELESAYSELSRALSLTPESVRTRYYFGMLLERLGDREGAADSFWYVLDTADPNAVYFVQATRALQRLGYQPEMQP